MAGFVPMPRSLKQRFGDVRRASTMGPSAAVDSASDTPAFDRPPKARQAPRFDAIRRVGARRMDRSR